ncbi:MAG: DNA cytosine methyltransferase [Rhizobiales bacterium]|nr:DNA cytosine methyltransferase [Hyphomicrobiales bacterium]
MLLSLFCGAGGLDLGFEQAGFEVGLAFDRNAQSVSSYNLNRADRTHGFVRDVTTLTPARLDKIADGSFNPTGLIGGPPCQSFSQANVNQSDNDPRHVMPLAYARLLRSLNRRHPVDFFVFENVVGLTAARHQSTLEQTKKRLERAGFNINQQILNACDFGTPQTRPRLFIVGYNTERFGSLKWKPPAPLQTKVPTVRDAIEALPQPTYFSRGIKPEDISFHPNHWCMMPKSPKFFRKEGLKEGLRKGRSFKTLTWDTPSMTVAYGHREVHVHPNGRRRLSVYEAMKLQGFPNEYVLFGTLSSQITQVSEAVPPPMAKAIALSIYSQLYAAQAGKKAA